jgi:hypothetical protein
MEILNLNPLNYQRIPQEEVQQLIHLMFYEFSVVKNLLAFLDPADILACLSLRISPLKRAKLPKPRLKLSLLLADYVKAVLAEARRTDGPPLLAVFGPGKGEELIPFLKNGFSVLCFDVQDANALSDLFRGTFAQAGVATPDLVVVGEGANVDRSFLLPWRERGCPPTVFICCGIDFSQEGAIPEEIMRVSRVASSIYVLHEMRRRGLFLRTWHRHVVALLWHLMATRRAPLSTPPSCRSVIRPPRRSAAMMR